MKITEEKKIELARRFFELVFDDVEQGEDVIYEFLDPECKYGEELIDTFNNDTVKEVISIGFKQKYGVDWEEKKVGSDNE